MLPAAEGTGMPAPSPVWGPFPAREGGWEGGQAGGLGKGTATGVGLGEECGSLSFGIVRLTIQNHLAEMKTEPHRIVVKVKDGPIEPRPHALSSAWDSVALGPSL